MSAEGVDPHEAERELRGEPPAPVSTIGGDEIRGDAPRVRRELIRRATIEEGDLE